MAIAYDSSAQITQSNTTSITGNHTCSGSNRLLFVVVLANTSDTITGVTYNSTSLTLVDKQQGRTSGRWEYLYYLVNPSTGTNAVVVSASTTTYMAAGFSSYTGCDQGYNASIKAKNTTTTGTTLATSVTTTTNNSWTVMGSINSDGVCLDTGGGTKLRQTSISGVGLYDSDSAITPAGSTTLTSSIVGTIQHQQANIMTAFAPVSSTNIKSINGLAHSSIKSINGLVVGSIKSFNGLA